MSVASFGWLFTITPGRCLLLVIQCLARERSTERFRIKKGVNQQGVAANYFPSQLASDVHDLPSPDRDRPADPKAKDFIWRSSRHPSRIPGSVLHLGPLMRTLLPALAVITAAWAQSWTTGWDSQEFLQLGCRPVILFVAKATFEPGNLVSAWLRTTKNPFSRLPLFVLQSVAGRSPDRQTDGT